MLYYRHTFPRTRLLGYIISLFVFNTIQYIRILTVVHTTIIIVIKYFYYISKMCYLIKLEIFLRNFTHSCTNQTTPASFKTLSNSSCIIPLLATIFLVLNVNSSPARSVKLPPASFIINAPAAISHELIMRVRVRVRVERRKKLCEEQSRQSFYILPRTHFAMYMI